MTESEIPYPSYSTSLADQNFITYADRTGETAVANLSGDVTIRWRNGFTIRIPEGNTRWLIRWLNTFTFTRSSRGMISAAKEKDPGAPCGAAPASASTGAQSRS